MASSDARPFPIKNIAYRVTFPIFDADGDLVTGAADLDSEYSGDGGTFANCTNEATEIATSSGMYYLDLAVGEMNYDTVAIIVKTSTSGAKTTPLVLYPVESTDIPVNVKAISDDATAADNLELITEIANITSLTVDASGHLECDVVEIEGADPTDTIRDAVVDDATRIDASALNTLSGHDPGSTLCADGTPLTAAETESEANDALVALHLDHLLATDYDPASKPGTATALLNEIMESDGGVSRFTANALEQGPDTTTALTLHSDYDAAKSAAPASEYDTEMARITANVALASICTETRLAELDAANLPTDIADVPTVAEFNARTQPTADYFDAANDAVANVTLVTTTTTNTDMVGTDNAALASVCTETRLAELAAANLPTDIAALPTTAEVNTEVDTALSDIHLDHLFATDYDPASKPGTATALLNELMESDAGVSQFTENSLEQAPSGTGGDATEAKQDTIITHLTDVKGATFADTDSLEAIRDRGDAAWVTGAGGTAGSGAITFTYTLTSSVNAAPIAQADVWVTTDEAGTNVIASGTTSDTGTVTFYLDAGTYYVWRAKSGWDFTNPDTEVITA